uniref:Type IV pilus assembly PilZ n=1 Tax=Geobacter sp. (strain M21) TaxID=443144 RepID=C6E0W4_GEOSM
MEDEYSEYREYLGEGMRIEIGIPLSGGGVFRDWAVVAEGNQDELVVQISRDVLPSEVRCDIGFILDVSIWARAEVYTCSGIVIEKLGGRVLRIRLFGSFTLRERRQFFRIELGMRVKYDIIDESLRRDVERDWEVRKEHEHMKFQGYDDFVIAAQMARFRPAKPIEWQDLLRAQLNLGGGGLCLRIPQKVQPEQLMNLELHLPLDPPRVVHTVVRVIHIKPPRQLKDGSCRYDTGMQFDLLDERDRDLIFKQISVAQIEHLRKLADKREPADADGYGRRKLTPRQILARLAWGALFLLLTWVLARLLSNYSPSNQIEKTYEQSLKKYRHQD